MSNVYDDVAELQTQVAALQSQVAQLQGTVTNINTKLNTYATDSGWLNLPLSTGIEAYATTQIPQYRKIGKTVFIRGGIKGIVNDSTHVATLPEGCRPERVYHFLQNKTASGGVPMVARWKIESNGRIIMVFAENQSEATHWFALDTTFLIN